jgi:hypothetical protein
MTKHHWRSWALVAHACNPSYSGGRDQEDHGSNRQNVPQDAILKKPFTKKRLMEWLKVEALSSNPNIEKKIIGERD